MKNKGYNVEISGSPVYQIPHPTDFAVVVQLESGLLPFPRSRIMSLDTPYLSIYAMLPVYLNG